MPTNTIARQRVRQYRSRQRAVGLRPLQIWVPDTRSADLAARIRRQCRALHSDPSESQAAAFSEKAARLIKGWQ